MFRLDQREVCNKFADDCNIKLIFSSQKYPQSNGLAEKGIAIAKNLLKQCYKIGEKDMFQYRILEYNITPVASMKVSPAQLFFGRLIKTKLPMEKSLLLRKTINESEIQDRMERKREKQRKYYNEHAKLLPDLNEGERIVFKKNGKELWHYGKIVKNVNERSYIVVDNYNNYYRRNRRFIAKTKNKYK